jgi:hypothetical protein
VDTGLSLTVGVAALLAATVAPLLFLAYYNFPSVSDDYCVYNLAHDRGAIGLVGHYYLTFTGRFASIGSLGILYSLIDLLGLEWPTMFRVMPPLLAAVWTLCAYWAVTSWTGGILSLAERMLLTGVALLAYLLNLPSLTEELFWLSGSMTYTTSHILLLALLAMAGGFGSGITRVRAILLTAGMSAASVLIAGTNESAAVMLTMLTAPVAAWIWLKKQRLAAVIVGAAALGGVAAALLAPGNATRIGGGDHISVLGVAFQVVYRSLSTFPEWVTLSLLACSVIALPWLWRLAQRYPYRRVVHPAWYYLGLGAVMCAMLTPFIWGRGGENIVGRVWNLVHGVFLPGWFVGLYFVSVHLQKRYGWTGQGMMRLAKNADARLAVIAGLTLIVIRSPYFDDMAKEVILKRAPRHYRTMQEREAVVAAAKAEGRDSVTLPALSPDATRLLIRDLDVHPDFSLNRCYAEFYGIKDVSVSK